MESHIYQYNYVTYARIKYCSLGVTSSFLFCFSLLVISIEVLVQLHFKVKMCRFGCSLNCKFHFHKFVVSFFVSFLRACAKLRMCA